LGEGGAPSDRRLRPVAAGSGLAGLRAIGAPPGCAQWRGGGLRVCGPDLRTGPAFRGRRVAGDTGRAAKFPEAASRGRRGGGGGGELSFLVWRSNW